MNTKKILVIDAVILLIYLVVANPSITGIGIHEWLGIGVLLVFITHTALHYDWIVDATRNAFRTPSWARTGNLLLDVAILIVFMVCMVSGILVSGTVLAEFGLYADGYYFWDPLHAVTAKALFALLLVHMVVHWKWFLVAFRNIKQKVGEKDGC